MRLPPPNTGAPKPSSERWGGSNSSNSNSGDENRRNNMNPRQHHSMENQKNTLGDFLLSNHDVMNKIIKYDEAARKQNMLQLETIPHEESISTIDDIKRSQAKPEKRHLAIPSHSDEVDRTELPTPKMANNNSGRVASKRTRITMTTTTPGSEDSYNHDPQISSSTNPFRSASPSASRPRSDHSPSTMLTPPTVDMGPFGSIPRQPSPNPSTSSHNAMPTRASPASPATTIASTSSNQNHSHRHHPPNSSFGQRHPSPNYTMSAQSTLNSRASQGTPNNLSFNHAVYQSPSPNPSLSSAINTVHSRSSPPIIVSSNGNVELEAGVSPQTILYYNAEQEPGLNRTRTTAYVNTGGQSMPNPRIDPYRGMPRTAPQQHLPLHRHVRNQPPDLRQAPSYDVYGRQSPVFEPNTMCYNNAALDHHPVNIENRSPSQGWAPSLTTSQSLPEKSLADEAIDDCTPKKSTEKKKRVKKVAPSAPVAAPVSHSAASCTPFSSNSTVHGKESSKSNNTGGGIFEYMKSNLLTKPSIMCGPPIATFSPDPGRAKQSTLWSILDPTEDLDYTDDDDEDYATLSSSPTLDTRTARDTRNKKEPRSASRSRSPSRKGNRSKTSPYTEAYEDLMFISKRPNGTEGERTVRASRKSPRTQNRDSPLKGSRSVHYEGERENARRTPRKTIWSAYPYNDGDIEMDNGHQRSSRQKVRDSPGSEWGDGRPSNSQRQKRQSADTPQHNSFGRRVRAAEQPTTPTPKRSHRERSKRRELDDSDESFDEVSLFYGSDLETVQVRSRSRSADPRGPSKQREEISDEENNYPLSRRRSTGDPKKPSHTRTASQSPSRAKSALREGRFNARGAKDARGCDNPLASSGNAKSHQSPEVQFKLGKRVLSNRENQNRKSTPGLSGPTIAITSGTDSRVSALSEDSDSPETRKLRMQFNKVMCGSGKKVVTSKHGKDTHALKRRIPARLPGAQMRHTGDSSADSATSDTSTSFVYHDTGRLDKDALDVAFDQCLGHEFEDVDSFGGLRGRRRRVRRSHESSSVSLSSGSRSASDAKQLGIDDVQPFGKHEGNYMYVAYSRFGDNAREVIQLCEHASMPVANARAGEVLVKVLASTISMTDCEVRRGEWSEVKLNPFIIPGSAFVGQIHKSEKKSAFSSFQPGDLVMSLVKSGSNARYMCPTKDRLIKVPSSVDPANAVCLAEAYLSAFQALHLGHKSGMRYRNNSLKGKSILVLGGATGLGIALIELALAAGAETVYATTKERQFETLSAVGAIPLTRDPQDWLTLIGNKIHTIVCVDNGIYAEHVTPEHLKALNREGQVVIIGPPGIEASALTMSAATPSKLMCSSNRNKLRARSQYYNVFDQWGKDSKLCKRDLAHLLELLQKKSVNPDVLERIPLSKVAKAQSIVESKRLSGFIVCNPWK